MNKGTKAKIKDKLEWACLNETGIRRLNGSWSEVKGLKIRKVKNEPNCYLASGEMHYGIDNTGDGRSETYSERFEDIKIDLKEDDKDV